MENSVRLLRETLTPEDKGALQAYSFTEVQSEMRKLGEFGKQIQSFGNFLVLDTDPLKPEYGQVVYQLGPGNHHAYTLGMAKEKRKEWDKRFDSHDCLHTTKICFYWSNLC